MSGYVWKTTWLALLAVAVLLGCRQEQPPVDPPPKQPAGEEPAQTTAVEAAAPEETAPAEPAPPPKIPEVVMTQAMAATNVVGVGDAMPEGQLPDLESKTHTLKELHGPKLTVVFFWKSDNLYALEELRDLQADVFGPYKDGGVQVIGVNVGDEAETVKAKVAEAKAAYPQLLDRDAAWFAKIAKEHLPRTYLLDADGKILWFDLEYSTATRRNLKQAIEVALKPANP